MGTFNKLGEVVATDAKYTGEEPTWDDVNTMTREEIEKRATDALKFYNYYCSTKDLMPDLTLYMESENFSKEKVKAVKRHADKYFSVFTNAKIARMVNRGMPKDSENPIYESLRGNIQIIADKALREDQHSKEEVVDTKPKAPVIPPMKRLENKVNAEVIAQIDWAQDDWLDKPHEIGPLNVIQLLSGANIPAKGCTFVYEYLDRHIAELQDAVDGTCDQAVEGWSFLTRVQLKKWLKAFVTMRADTAKYEKTHKKAVVRTKKVKPAGVQVKALKYNKDNSKVSAVKIPGAVNVILFNEKTKKIIKYSAISRNGLSVKGTSIKDFDTDKSVQYTLRKNYFDTVLESKNILKDFDKGNTGKSQVPNGRVNEHCIILYAK